MQSILCVAPRCLRNSLVPYKSEEHYFCGAPLTERTVLEGSRREIRQGRGTTLPHTPPTWAGEGGMATGITRFFPGLSWIHLYINLLLVRNSPPDPHSQVEEAHYWWSRTCRGLTGPSGVMGSLKGGHVRPVDMRPGRILRHSHAQGQRPRRCLEEMGSLQCSMGKGGLSPEIRAECFALVKNTSYLPM